MNFKVIIIDDNQMEIDYLSRNVDWDSYSMEVCGTAHNGIRGLKLFDVIHPDLVIADIEMPGLDGIEMAKRIRARSASARIVFLSSYSVFEYAKSGYELGVSAYILKQDIGTPKLAEQFQKLRAELICVSSQALETETRTFGSLFDGTLTCANLPNPLSEKKMGLAVLFLDRFVPVVTPYAKEKWRDSDWGTVKIHLETDDIVLLRRSESRAIVLWRAGSHLCEDVCVSTLQAARRALGEDVLHAPRIVLLSRAAPVSSLVDIYQRAKPDFAARFFLEPYATVEINALRSPKSARETSPNPDMETLDHAMRRGEANAMKAWFSDAFCAALTGCRAAQIEDLFRRLLVYYAESIYERTHERLTLSEKELAQCVTWRGAVEMLENRVLRYASEESAFAENRFTPAVSAAVRYIRMNFATKTLTIDEVAESVALSSSRLRTIFKEDTGLTPSEYLMEMRMSHAEFLLRSTMLCADEIADQVGYLSGKYLRRIFKQKHNKTPRAYREMSRR